MNSAARPAVDGSTRPSKKLTERLQGLIGNAPLSAVPRSQPSVHVTRVEVSPTPPANEDLLNTGTLHISDPKLTPLPPELVTADRYLAEHCDRKACNRVEVALRPLDHVEAHEGFDAQVRVRRSQPSASDEVAMPRWQAARF
jgi:hypothetical protein